MPGMAGGGCPGPSLLEIIERMPPGLHKEKRWPRLALQTTALIGPLIGTASLAKPAVMTIRKLSQCPEDKREGVLMTQELCRLGRPWVASILGGCPRAPGPRRAEG